MIKSLSSYSRRSPIIWEIYFPLIFSPQIGITNPDQGFRLLTTNAFFMPQYITSQFTCQVFFRLFSTIKTPPPDFSGSGAAFATPIISCYVLQPSKLSMSSKSAIASTDSFSASITFGVLSPYQSIFVGSNPKSGS